MKTLIVLLALLASVLSMSCDSGDVKPNMKTPPFFIDSHIHYVATDAWEKSFLEIYGKHNAMACIIVRMNDLDRGIAFAKAHPDRVIPYAEIEIDSASVLQDIQKVYDMGYKGLGEIFATKQWKYDDPKYEPIWVMAEKLGMPIMVHTGILANGLMAQMQPGFLATIASNHPKLIILGAHFGNPWYAEAAEATRRNANLYFNLCGSSLIKKENDPGYWAQWLWWSDAIGKAHMPDDAVHPWKKMMFATDETPDQLDENIRRFNKALDACKVPDSIRIYCYGLAIAKMHGIKFSTSK
jgi:uncharacterized protein